MSSRYRKPSALIFLIGMVAIFLIDQRENEALSAAIWKILGLSASVYLATNFSKRRGLIGFFSRLIIEGLDGIDFIFKSLVTFFRKRFLRGEEAKASAVGQVSSNEEDSERLTFEISANSEAVKALLERIEDKILSTSRLTNLTGDNEAELSLRYQWTTDDTGTDGPYLVIDIRSETCSTCDEESAEAFRDYVNDQVNSLLTEIDYQNREPLERAFGEIVCLNGIQVY